MMFSAIQGVDGCMDAFGTGMGILTARAREIHMARALEQTTVAYRDLSARYNELLMLSESVTGRLQTQLAKERAANRMLRDLLECVSRTKAARIPT